MLSNDDVKFIKAMRDEVRERGERYVYSEPNPPADDWAEVSTCFYVNYDLQPSCIIGRSLHRAGFATVEELSTMEGKSASVVMGSASMGFSSTFVNAANQAQGEQDGGTSWGEAYQTMLVELSASNDVSDFAL